MKSHPVHEARAGAPAPPRSRNAETDGVELTGPAVWSPRVSIVINNFNYRRFLQQSIESALAQTFARTEVVVVDDCSTDGSQELIREFGDRIVPVLQGVNGGQAAAMNAGFAACTGNVVIFLDADDYLYPTAAELVAEVFASKVAMVQYRLHLVDADGRMIDLYPRPELRFDTGDVRRKLVATGRFEGTVTSGMAFAREALAAVLPIPTETFRISADGYLLSTLPFYGDVLAIEEPLGAYRLHGSNLWSVASNAAVGFRRCILHDAVKHRELSARAAAFGFQVSAEPGLRDYQHVSARLGSLLLDPDKHPTLGDARLALGLHGVMAARRAALPWRLRVLLGLWFAAVGILPQSWARAWIRWRYEPNSRSPALRRVLRSLRRVAGRATQT